MPAYTAAGSLRRQALLKGLRLLARPRGER
jgi:hypothetical protein